MSVRHPVTLEKCYVCGTKLLMLFVCYKPIVIVSGRRRWAQTIEN